VTLEESKDLSQFSLDELQSSPINLEQKLNRSNMPLENAFSAQSSIRCERGRGRYNSRGRRISSVRGRHNNSPRNTSERGQNQYTGQPSGQRTNKSKI
jgi:hypothetical protein